MKPVLLMPNNFSTEQIKWLNGYKYSIARISSTDDTIIMGIKDITSRYIFSTNAHAKLVGLEKRLCGF